MEKARTQKRGRKLKLAACALAYLSCSCLFSTAHTEGINIPGQTLIISKEKWTDREVTLSGSGESAMLIYGGEKNGNLNTVGIDGSSNYIGLFGGYYDGINEGNPVAVTGNVINVVTGGEGWLVYDDPNKISNEYSRLYLYDTSGYGLAVNAVAGHAGLGEASGNVVNLHPGGMVNGYVVAAESKTSAADTAKTRLHDNTVNIYGYSNLSQTSVFGAALFDDATRGRAPTMGTNNTLNTYYIESMDINELAGFNKYNLYLPLDIRPNDLVLNVNGDLETNIGGGNIIGVLHDSVLFQVNDEVTLMQNSAGIPSDDTTTYKGIHSETGLSTGYNTSAKYRLVVEKYSEERIIMRLEGIETKPETKTIPQSRVPVLINRGGDFLAAGALDSAAGSQTHTPFFATTGSAMRHTTGSHLDMRGFNGVVGLSLQYKRANGNLLIAPLVEYGHGNYDAYVDSGARCEGSARYVGVGVVFRNKFNNGVFYEGSLRGGKQRSDYASDSFSHYNKTYHETFETSSYYVGAHFGVGKEIPWHKKGSLMYYGRFFFTHVGTDSMSLTTGDKYWLSAINSERLRLGARYTYKANKHNTFYTGLAWEHEFNGSSYAVYEGLRTDTPTLRGDSAMMELGWVTKADEDNRLSLDLSAAGWIGNQRGITGRLGINWMF